MSTDLRGHPWVACFQKFPSLIVTGYLGTYWKEIIIPDTTSRDVKRQIIYQSKKNTCSRTEYQIPTGRIQFSTSREYFSTVYRV
jgi:hypothetical protein